LWQLEVDLRVGRPMEGCILGRGEREAVDLASIFPKNKRHTKKKNEVKEDVTGEGKAPS
jgi:hypothetical protein